MTDNTMNDTILEPGNIINIITTLNNSFNNLYYKYTLENLQKCNIKNVDYNFIKQQITPNVYQYYLNGHCASYSEILCNIFGKYATKYNSSNHVIVKIGENFYDVRGLINDIVDEEFHITEKLDSFYIETSLGIKDELEKPIEKALIDIGKEELHYLLQNAQETNHSIK